MTAPSTEEERARLKQRLIAQKWKQLATSARRAGNTVLAEHAERSAAEVERVKIGDVIAGMTSALGIKPCGDCKKRQAALNTVDTTQPTVDIIKDIFRALTS